MNVPFDGFQAVVSHIHEDHLGHVSLRVAHLLAAGGTWRTIRTTEIIRHSIHGFAEFDGLVLEAWTETVPDENSSTEVPYLAIDDGAGDRAWVFAVSSEQYAVGIPGPVVHATAGPRRGALLQIRPILPGTPD
jgi:hypothetical protein